jgi:uncharacterized protein
MNYKQPYTANGSQAVARDEGLRQYMLGVYNYMTGALALTAFVAYLIANVPAVSALFYHVGETGKLGYTPLGLIAMFAPLGLILFASFRFDRMSAGSLQGTFWAIAGIMGMSLSVLLLAYTGTSIIKVFLVTSIAFGGLSLYGYTTKRDMTAFGSFLVMGVIGLLVTGIVNMFLQSPAVHFAMCGIGVLLFAGLTAFDTQNIRRTYYAVAGSGEMAAKASVMGALSLYLDFINMFQFLLAFLGDRR